MRACKLKVLSIVGNGTSLIVSVIVLYRAVLSRFVVRLVVRSIWIDLTSFIDAIIVLIFSSQCISGKGKDCQKTV